MYYKYPEIRENRCHSRSNALAPTTESLGTLSKRGMGNRFGNPCPARKAAQSLNIEAPLWCPRRSATLGISESDPTPFDINSQSATACRTGWIHPQLPMTETSGRIS